MPGSLRRSLCYIDCSSVLLISDRTRPSEANDASFSDFFIFHFLATFLFFHSPPPSFLSSLPPCPSFFLVQHCLNHLESVKVHFSAILTKALRTDQPTDQPTDRRTRPLIEMRTHLKKKISYCYFVQQTNPKTMSDTGGFLQNVLKSLCICF